MAAQYAFPPWHPLAQQPRSQRVQMNRKKYRRKRKKSCYCFPVGSQTTCSAVLGLSLFLILIVVIAIAALAIYIGMEIILDGSLRVTYGDYYTTELYNKTSQLFLTNAHMYKVMIEKVFAKSVLGPALKHCVVMGFKNGSLIIFYRLILDRRKVPSRIFANIEETAKKVLFEEITTIKPTVFSNVRLDPKQIIIKRHALNADDQMLSHTDSALETASSTTSVLRRKPTLVKRKPITSTTTARNLKHPLTIVDKTSKIKLQLETDEENVVKGEIKRVTNVQNTRSDASRYSFVSEDVKSNGTHGFGEAEVVTVSTSSEAVVEPKSDVVNAQTINVTSERGRKHEKVSNGTHAYIEKLSIHRNVSVNLPAKSNVNVNQPLRPKPVSNYSSTIERVQLPALMNLETRSKSPPFDHSASKSRPNEHTVSVTKLPTIETTETELTTEKFHLSAAITTHNTEQTTEDVIVLNTEVVTSTSMHVSYGDNVFDDYMDAMMEKQIYESITEAVTTTRPKYKNIFPRNMRARKTVENEIGQEGMQYDTKHLRINDMLVDRRSFGFMDTVTEANIQSKRLFPRSITIPTDQQTMKKKLNQDEKKMLGSAVNARYTTQVYRDEVGQKRLNDKADQNFTQQMDEKIVQAEIDQTSTKNEMDQKSINLANKSSVDQSSYLNGIIETYKKHPSNETLHLIIEQLASMFTKITTPAIFSTRAIDVKQNANGLLVRPLHKIHDVTTTEVPKTTAACQDNYPKRCADGQCIPEESWCNQLVDCVDGSDERNCTCADYMKAQFAYKKICDGIVDCWDFSDEKSCEWCSPDKYVCANAKLCIDENQLCDGNRDCPLGDDEKNCITIVPFARKNNDITYHSTGIITVRRIGEWGKLCHKKDGNVDSNDKILDRLEELGKAVCRTMTYRNFVGVKSVPDLDSDVDSSQLYYKLTNVEKNNTYSFRRKHFKFVRTECQSKAVIQVTCDNLECGIQTQIGQSRIQGRYHGERHSRIVGGGSAALGAWPWLAALYKEGEFQCGATLISDKWLLSAGHCFNNAFQDYWVARLGILRRGSTLPSPHEQLRSIRRIVLHPNYAEAGFLNDISMLEMSDPVDFTNFVRPICLTSANSVLMDGTMCTVVGWGQLMETGRIYPDTLQEVQLPVISTAECRKRTIFLPLYKITDNMLCAGYDRGGRDACLGDSGGPLMCQNSENKWTLYGVTSNGYGCARAHRPGVYTKVANYINWIDNNLNNEDNLNGTTRVVQSVCKGHRCPLGECLPKASICNGYMECSDGSDEKYC